MVAITVEKSGRNEVSLIQRTFWILNVIYFQVLALVSVVLIWILLNQSKGKLTKSSVHSIFATAAFIPLMATAITMFSKDNVTTLYIPRTKRYWIHGVLLILSCVILSTGIIVKFQAKNEFKGRHFKSTHAILGLTSWVLVLVSVVLGTAAANSQKFSGYIRPVFMKLVHNLLGMAAFSIGVATLWQMLGHFESSLSDSAYTGVKVGVIYLAIWSLLAAKISLWRQLKTSVS